MQTSSQLEASASTAQIQHRFPIHHVDMHKDQNNNLMHAEGTTMIAGIGESTTNVDLQGLGKEASGIQDTIFLIHHELRCGRPRGP